MVMSYLELVLQQILFVGDLSVESKEPLLIGREFLHVQVSLLGLLLKRVWDRFVDDVR